MSNRANTLTLVRSHTHAHRVKMKGAATAVGGAGRERDSEDCSLTSWLGGKAGVACWGPPDRHLSGGGAVGATSARRRHKGCRSVQNCPPVTIKMEYLELGFDARVFLVSCPTSEEGEEMENSTK